jgi:Caspase domain
VGGVSLIYFAGHGLVYGEQSYLAPYDAFAIYSRDLREEFIPLDLLYDAMREMGDDVLHIVVLDACRNPGLGKLPPISETGEIVEPSGGVKLNPVKNLIFATSASLGQHARDGTPGQNSPYANSLSESIQNNNVPIDITFRDVRRYFQQPPFNGNDPQQPQYNNEDLVYFYFRPTRQTYEDEKRAWDAIDHATATLQDYQNFLDQYPAGYFARQAPQRRADLPHLAAPVAQPMTAQLVEAGSLLDSPSDTGNVREQYAANSLVLVVSPAQQWTFVQLRARP